MIVFMLVVFGLATIRTITPFAKNENYESASSFIAQLLLTVPTVICYVWLLKHFVTLNGA
jgi:hypothetical protein